MNPLQMSYWDEEEGELWGYVSELLIGTLIDGMGGGVDALPANVRVLVDWDWLNQSALNYARTYRYSLIKSITDTTRRQVQQAMQEWINSGAPLSSLEAQLAPIFGEVRAAMIAATETTRVYAEANVMAWDSTGVVDGRKWMTAEDDLVCPICGALDGEERANGEAFAPDIQDPPGHVNCRCWINPIVSDDKLAEKLDRILGS
jgi:SPP1 gp7 family putative phage head morphogenesis protein